MPRKDLANEFNLPPYRCTFVDIGPVKFPYLSGSNINRLYVLLSEKWIKDATSEQGMDLDGLQPDPEAC